MAAHEDAKFGFAETERFARQLREVDHDDQVAMKRAQFVRPPRQFRGSLNLAATSALQGRAELDSSREGQP